MARGPPTNVIFLRPLQSGISLQGADPGCSVDIPGALYSLSWFPNPNFTSLFPSQKEILSYIQRVARTYNVTDHVELQIEWKGAQWVESSGTWHVSLRNLRTEEEFLHEAKVLVFAVGGYTNPKFPILPGLDTFEGPVVHTAKWNKEYDLRGLNVAVVGNGCLFTYDSPVRDIEITFYRFRLTGSSCCDR